MNRRNGFLTLYVLCVGLLALTIAISSSVLCRTYMENARNYATAIRLTYAAESMLYPTWEEFTAVPLSDFKAMKRWYSTDPYGILEPTDTLEMYWVAAVYSYPYTGSLWAIVYDTRTHSQRTSALRFRIERGEDGVTPIYTVTKQLY